MDHLLEIVKGLAAGLLYIFVIGPSGAVIDFLVKLWRTRKGEPLAPDH